MKKIIRDVAQQHSRFTLLLITSLWYYAASGQERENITLTGSGA